MAIAIGSEVRVTEAGWTRYEEETKRPFFNKFGCTRVVMDLPSHTPFENHALLNFPYFWFRLDELEEITVRG